MPPSGGGERPTPYGESGAVTASGAGSIPTAIIYVMKRRMPSLRLGVGVSVSGEEEDGRTGRGVVRCRIETVGVRWRWVVKTPTNKAGGVVR